MSIEPYLTFNDTNGRIYLNQNGTQEDVTENVIEVVSQWFLITDLTIGLQNYKTGKRYMISCIEADDSDFPPHVTKH